MRKTEIDVRHGDVTAADVDVLVFCGGVLASPEGGIEQRNAVYDLVDPHGVDGVVVMAGAIMTMGYRAGRHVAARRPR